MERPQTLGFDPTPFDRPRPRMVMRATSTSSSTMGGKERGLMTLVSARDGEASNIRYITRNQAKAKGFLNRDRGSPLGYGPNEQPSATVLNAIVAADRTEG